VIELITKGILGSGISTITKGMLRWLYIFTEKFILPSRITTSINMESRMIDSINLPSRITTSINKVSRLEV